VREAGPRGASNLGAVRRLPARGHRPAAEGLLHNEIDTGFFVAAYPHATVPRVKAALAARERLIAFAVRTQGMSAKDLRRAFDEEF